jgi:glutamyl-tRNA reductase
MMTTQLLFLGLNHTTASVSVREKLSGAPNQMPDLLRALRDIPGVEETAVISTCNRIEIYTLVDRTDARQDVLVERLATLRGMSACDLSRYVCLHSGEAAAQHLFRVAAGLDSLMLGEHQILGQVKDALEAAQGAESIGPILAALFRQAITTGKRVRSETEIGRGARSLGQVAVSLARDQLGDLTNRTALLVGVGKINKLAARALVESGLRWLLIANRTFERAVEMAESLGGRAVHFDALASSLAEADMVIVATGAPHIVLHQKELRDAMAQRAGRRLVVIDLAVPRNVDPAVRSLPDVHLYDMDDLSAAVVSNHPVAAPAIAAAEAIVAQELGAFATWWRERLIAPIIVSLHAQAEMIRRTELEKAFCQLGSLSLEQQRTVTTLASTLTNKLLYASIHAIKS